MAGCYDMIIRYRGDLVAVEVLAHEEGDDYQPYLFMFPENHSMHLSQGVWLPSADYEIVQDYTERRVYASD